MDIGISMGIMSKYKIKAKLSFLKKNGGDIMSFLFEELTREECEDIREKDGYYKAKKEDASKMKNMNISIEQIIEVTGLSREEIEEL